MNFFLIINKLIKMIKELIPKDETIEFLLYSSPNGDIKVEVSYTKNIWLTQKNG